jgi:hypothetical protein
MEAMINAYKHHSQNLKEKATLRSIVQETKEFPRMAEITSSKRGGVVAPHSTILACLLVPWL